jgi:protoheme IX farnesyltransferase
MLPVVRGSRATRNQILAYSVIMSASAVAPWALGYFGPVYGTVAAVFSVGFLLLAALLWRSPAETERRDALRLFAYSILYLFALFTAVAAERLVGLSPIAS